MRVWAAGVVLAAMVAGCVSSYDPSGPPRLGLGTLGPGMQKPRAVAQAPSQPEAQPVARPGSVSSTTIPDTAAGRQLAWFMTALNGTANLKRIGGRFAPAFLEHVPVAQVRTVVRHWRRDQLANGKVGIYRLTEEGPGAIVAVLEPRGGAAEEGRYTRVWLSVDEEGRISGLRLAPAVDVDPGVLNSWERLDARLAALPGRVSFAAYQVGADGSRPVHTFNADERLAIGSTFKLYILGALAEMIATGEASWDQPLAIQDRYKSLPSGSMQLEDEGDEFPLERYAELMISISDNTAADHLLAFVGRERVEAFMARLSVEDERNTPFLSTMEMFRLKLAPDRLLADRFADASEDEQRAMVAPGGELEQHAPSAVGAMMWRAPYEIGRVEWFASASELARLMAHLHTLEQRPGMEPLARILRVNPGLAFDPDAWTGVAYKGGSEPGVLNMTWLLTRADGRDFAVSVTWNNAEAPVDLSTLAELVGAGIGLLAREGAGE